MTFPTRAVDATTIDWRATRDALAAEVGGLTGPLNLRRVGLDLQVELEAVGEKYDEFFPPAPASPKGTVLIESEAHFNWRIASGLFVNLLQEIADRVDGKGEVPYAPDAILGAYNDTIARMKLALSGPQSADREILKRTLSYADSSNMQSLMSRGEPRFYVDEYYELSHEFFAPSRIGEAEAALVEKLSVVDVFMGLV